MRIVILFLLLLPVICFAQQPDLTLFYEAYMHQRYESACAILDLLIEQHPENASLHMYMGKTRLAMRQYGRAVKSLQTAESMQFSDPHLYHYLGLALKEEGLLEEAIRAFDKALWSHPDPIPLRLRIAGLHYEQKRYDQAISNLNEILSDNPDHLRALFECGRAYFKKTVYDSATAYFEKGLDVDSSSFSCKLYLGMTLYHGEEYEPAEKWLREAVSLSRHSDIALYYLALSLSKLKQPAEAIRLLREAVDLKGSYRMKALRRLVEFTYRIEDYDACLQEASSYFSGPPDEHLYLVYYYQGRALSDLGRHAAADSALTKSLTLSNLDFIRTVAFFQGLNAYLQGDYPRSIQLYKRTIAIDPAFVPTYYNLAVVYDAYYEDKSTALDFYEKYLRLAEGNDSQSLLIQAASNRITQIKESDFFSRSQ